MDGVARRDRAAEGLGPCVSPPTLKVLFETYIVPPISPRLLCTIQSFRESSMLVQKCTDRVLPGAPGNFGLLEKEACTAASRFMTSL